MLTIIVRVVIIFINLNKKIFILIILFDADWHSFCAVRSYWLHKIPSYSNWGDFFFFYLFIFHKLWRGKVSHATNKHRNISPPKSFTSLNIPSFLQHFLKILLYSLSNIKSYPSVICVFYFYKTIYSLSKEY